MKTSVVIIIFCVVFLAIFGLSQMYINYLYERDIGSHMSNAKDMNTPSRMAIELKLAKQGMVDAGLTENDYGALIFKKPDNSMKFQYNHLDSIIERTEAVELWYKEVYENGNSAETLGDVYEQKMDNLREFIYEDTRSDWIAKNAWLVKYHKLIYLNEIVYTILFIILFMAFIGFKT